MTTWGVGVVSEDRPAPLPPVRECQSVPWCPHPAAWRFATMRGRWPIELCEAHAAGYEARGIMEQAIRDGAVVATELRGALT